MRTSFFGRRLAFTVLLLTTVLVEHAAVMQPGQPAGATGGTLLFASSWENTTELGCTPPALLDTAWEDYGGSGGCSGSVHDADIVNDVAHGGTRPTPRLVRVRSRITV
jgi:hypothetical protein